MGKALTPRPEAAKAAEWWGASFNGILTVPRQAQLVTALAAEIELWLRDGLWEADAGRTLSTIWQPSPCLTQAASKAGFPGEWVKAHWRRGVMQIFPGRIQVNEKQGGSQILI